MRIVLIRHTSVDVEKGTCYGQSDVPVAATFVEEADATKALLDRLEPFDAVFSSPLTRARLLAAHCGYARPRLDNRLKEMYMGKWEMQRYDEIEDPHNLGAIIRTAEAVGAHGIFLLEEHVIAEVPFAEQVEQIVGGA